MTRARDLADSADKDIVGTLNVDGLAVDGSVSMGDILQIESTTGYGSIEMGGPSGAYIDFKSPFSDDYDSRILTNGTDLDLTCSTGSIKLIADGGQKLATTSTGVAITGNATFADNGKAIFGAGSDLQIYHDGSDNNSYIKENGAGSLYVDAANLIFRTDTGENLAKFLQNGQVQLFNDNALKLATTSTGVDVTGTITSDGLTVGKASSPAITLQETTGTYGYKIHTAISSSTDYGLRLRTLANKELATFNSNGDINFYEDTGTTAKLMWDASEEKLTSPSVDLTAIAKDISDTAVDVFVYDTSKDSDGGAWRKRTQGTSWYNETLNTATRGSRKEFPAVAVIVAETNQVTIYDGDDPDLPMWMVFNDGSTWIQHTGGFSVEMLNGILFVGRNFSNGKSLANWFCRRLCI